MRKLVSWVLLLVPVVVATAAPSQERKLEPLHVSYVSVSASRAPLWIAKEAGLYEKYGLDVRLVVIRGTQLPITALISGDIQIIAAPATGTMVAAARGLPVVVIGTFGPSTFVRSEEERDATEPDQAAVAGRQTRPRELVADRRSLDRGDAGQRGG